MTKKLKPDEAAQVTPELPPAGFQRDEELAKRTDQLQQAAETETPERFRFDPSRFRVENEIMQASSSIAVSNPDPEYAYRWIRFKGEGQMVEYLEAQSVFDTVTNHPVATWHVVKGDMPEARERRDVNGYRVIGDVLLMRCRKDIAKALELALEQKSLRRMLGADEGFQAEAQKHGFQVRNQAVADPASTVVQQQGSRTRLVSNIEGGPTNIDIARSLLGQKYDRAMREGTIPGMPAPGR